MSVQAELDDSGKASVDITCLLYTSNYEIGRAVGNYIASSLKGKGNVVELTGLGGSTPAMERHQGFMAAISNYPDIKLIDNCLLYTSRCV